MIELLTAAQLAERLKVRPSTVRRWALIGRIPEVWVSPKVRRFDFVQVLSALQKRGNSRHA